MALKHSAAATCLLLAYIVGHLPSPGDTKPTYYFMDDYIDSRRDLPSSPSADRFDEDLPYGVPLTSHTLRRLRRGYYYVDDGYIFSAAQKNANRRQDDAFGDVRGAEYKPIVAVRKTHTKRKKLFVPNFFG